MTPIQYYSMRDFSWFSFDKAESFYWNSIEQPLNLSKIDFIFYTFSWRRNIVSLGIFSSARMGFYTIKTYPGLIVFFANMPLPYGLFLISIFVEKYYPISPSLKAWYQFIWPYFDFFSKSRNLLISFFKVSSRILENLWISYLAWVYFYLRTKYLALW